MGRLDPLISNTHGAESDLDRKLTDRQTRKSHQAFVSSHTTTSAQPSLPFPPLLIYTHIQSPSLNANTLSILGVRHLLLHQQVVGLGKGEEPQGSKFMGRLLVHALLRSTLPSVPAWAFCLFYFLLSPPFQRFSLF